MPNQINKPYRLLLATTPFITMSSPSISLAKAIEAITVTDEKIERSLKDTARRHLWPKRFIGGM